MDLVDSETDFGSVFDLTRPATFEAVTKWRDDVNSKVILANDQPIPLVLLANKVCRS